SVPGAQRAWTTTAAATEDTLAIASAEIEMPLSDADFTVEREGSLSDVRGGQVTVEPGGQARLGHGAREAVDLGAVAQEHQRGQAADRVALGDARVGLGVDLDHLELPRACAREALEHRGDHPARRTPRGPEVDEDGH